MSCGRHVSVSVKLISPVALEEKMRFAIREVAATVGAGHGGEKS